MDFLYQPSWSKSERHKSQSELGAQSEPVSPNACAQVSSAQAGRPWLGPWLHAGGSYAVQGNNLALMKGA